jgi:hypothetical protein
MFRSPETPGAQVVTHGTRPYSPSPSSFAEKASVAGFAVTLPVVIMEIGYVLNETSLETGDVIVYGGSLASLALCALNAYRHVTKRMLRIDKDTVA